MSLFPRPSLCAERVALLGHGLRRWRRPVLRREGARQERRTLRGISGCLDEGHRSVGLTQEKRNAFNTCRFTTTKHFRYTSDFPLLNFKSYKSLGPEKLGIPHTHPSQVEVQLTFIAGKLGSVGGAEPQRRGARGPTRNRPRSSGSKSMTGRSTCEAFLRPFKREDESRVW